MKKIFFYAMMAAGALASCSQNEELAPENTPMGEMAPSAEAIVLSAATPSISADVLTRGAGTVGADGSTVSNQWNGQKLYFFACKKDIATGMASNNDIMQPNTYALNNEVGTVNKGEKSAVVWSDGKSRYFPRTGAYDFFGYYADDAAKSEPVRESLNGSNVISKNFTIDGSQDLMIARAELSKEQKDALKEDAAKAFSAFTARKGVQPSMKFEHLLTRLVFNVKGLGNSKPENVSVESIKVKSRRTGKLVVVYSDVKNKGIHWGTEAATFLSLQERVDGKMQALTPDKYFASATGVAKATQVGEALLVEPGVDHYDIEIEVKQVKDESGNAVPVEQQKATFKLALNYKDVKQPAGAVANPEGKFEASKSYTITVGVHGIKQIELEAELGKWVDGGSIEINPDDIF